MTLDEYTKERILKDVAGLHYLYGLKKVIRYDLDRHEEDSTESVAEHVYGMHLMAQYFLPLENPDGDWNKAKIFEMITLHDLDEIETGDFISWAKNPNHKEEEAAAIKIAITKSPEHIQEHIRRHLEEYKEQDTREARFVKAIDKIEPHVHVYNEMERFILKNVRATATQAISVKQPYMTNFPFIWKCCQTIHQELIAGDYYWPEGE